MKQVTVQSLQIEVLEVLYATVGDTTFTANQGYEASKSTLPINTVVQNSRDLGALLNSCNLKPVGSIEVVRAGYNAGKKINQWRLQRVPDNTTTIPVQVDPAYSVTPTMVPARLHPRVIKVRTVLSIWQEAIKHPIHPSYKNSFDMAMWWLQCCNWNVECVAQAINHATGSDRPLTAMALELVALQPATLA